MINFKLPNIRISGVVGSIPTNIVEVDSFSDKFGIEIVEKFKNISGIRQFRKAIKEQTASDLSFIAAQKIIKKKSIKPEKIGALIFASHSLDYRRPATACVLHKRLGLSKDCVAFDINMGCSSFVYGLITICSLMNSSNINKALLLVGETNSKNVSADDQGLAMLMGDGGGAVLLEKTTGHETIDGCLKSDGEGYKAVIIPAGGYRNMDASNQQYIFPDGNKRTLYNTYMNGVDVFNFTISDIPQTIKEFLDFTGKSINEYDCIVLHQANKYILNIISQRIKGSMEKIPISLDRYGNTSSASIPLTISDKYGASNDSMIIKTLMSGFGVGLSWGVVSADINTDDILPVIETDDYFAEGFINSPEHL